jgi:hypothetical protein
VIPVAYDAGPSVVVGAAAVSGSLDAGSVTSPAIDGIEPSPIHHTVHLSLR